MRLLKFLSGSGRTACERFRGWCVKVKKGLRVVREKEDVRGKRRKAGRAGGKDGLM